MLMPALNGDFLTNCRHKSDEEEQSEDRYTFEQRFDVNISWMRTSS